MRSMKLMRLGLVATTALTAVTAMSGPASAEPAAKVAPTCSGWLHQNKSGLHDLILFQGYMKVGPYAACGNVRYLPIDTKVYFHCERPNGYGNMWIYVRVAGTTSYGWISKDTVSWHYNNDNVADCNP